MKLLRLVVLPLLVVAASCSDSLAPEARGFFAAHQKWSAQNLHTYAYTLQRSCFCMNVHPLYVAVVNDTVAGVIDLETGEQVDSRLGETIEDLFAFIGKAIDRPAELIRVEYDSVKGFPSQIDYDGAASIADDETFYRASDVHPISPQT
jgi:hypothetical protein